MTWEEWKQKGSKHYKTGDIEQVDLFVADGSFPNWALNNIRKYAGRNVDSKITDINEAMRDMDKIIHYAEGMKIFFIKEYFEKAP